MSLSWEEPLWPAPLVVTNEPWVTVARPALMLTLYLGDPMPWAWEAARALLMRFLQLVPPKELTHFATSLRPQYLPITGADMAKVLHDLALPWNQASPRHLFWLRIVDDPETAGIAFSYREVDSRQQQRCGFLELTFPLSFDPDAVLGLALEIADAWPVLAGLAGYGVSWNPRRSATAMSGAFGWCRRYLGLGLADPEALSWYVPKGLPGTSWLTLVGRVHASSLKMDLPALTAHPFVSPVQVHERVHAVTFQAGEAPVLGDLNQLVYPSAYAEVAHLLGPHVVAEPPSFYGERWQEEPERTLQHHRRFVEPDSWR